MRPPQINSSHSVSREERGETSQEAWKYVMGIENGDTEFDKKTLMVLGFVGLVPGTRVFEGRSCVHKRC